MFGANAQVGMMSGGGSKTIALLHMDGSNGGTVFTDETGKQTWSATGGAVTDTGLQQFGTASLQCTAVGKYIVSSGNIDLTGVWTVECWILYNSMSATTHFHMSDNTNANYLYYDNSGGQQVFAISGNAGVATWSQTAPTTAVWHHVAFCSDGSATTCFYDGTKLTLSSGSGVINTNLPLRIGIPTGGTSNLQIDELRISNVIRYSGNFTPSVSAFTLD